MNRRNITFAIAAVLALGIGLVVYGVLTAPHKEVPPPRGVVVAAVRIPAHANIVPAMVTVVQRPADQVDPAALSDPSEAIGQVAMADIPAASPILQVEIAKPATPPPDVLRVADGMRAVTIPIDQVKGVAGLLRPGDLVDVIAVPPRGPGTPQGYAIVRGAKVLAVGTTVSTQEAPPASPGAAPTPPPAMPTTATLQVTPTQADTLTVADINTTLRLALRSPRERPNSLPPQDIDYSTPAPPAAPAAPHPPAGVPVINGDQVAGGKP